MNLSGSSRVMELLLWSLSPWAAAAQRLGLGVGSDSSILEFSISLSAPGSLAVSVADMTAPVVGSSGGVYALVSAHLANIVMVSTPVPEILSWPTQPLPRHHWAWMLICQSWVLDSLLCSSLGLESRRPVAKFKDTSSPSAGPLPMGPFRI